MTQNHLRTEEQQTSHLFLWTEKKNEETHYTESILPYVEAYFDEEIDYQNIMNQVESQLSEDKILEEIYLGTIQAGLKRKEVIEEFGMTAKDYDNGFRRLKTILRNIAKAFNLKYKAI